MSLTAAKMGANKGNLKARLEQEERDIKADLVELGVVKGAKKRIAGLFKKKG